MQKISLLGLFSLLFFLEIACKPEKSTPPCSDRYLMLSVEAEPESVKTYLQGLGIKSFFMSSQNYEWQSNAGQSLETGTCIYSAESQIVDIKPAGISFFSQKPFPYQLNTILKEKSLDVVYQSNDTLIRIYLKKD